jgi:signal transduction histidine kinase
MPPSPFLHLKRQVRWLQWILIALVAVIPLLPTSVFFFEELDHLRDRAHRQSDHFRLMLSLYIDELGMESPKLTRRLLKEMKVNNLISLRLMGKGGREIIRLGHPSRSLFPAVATSSFPSTSALLQQVQVEVASRWLVRDTARIFGIHIIVVTVLGLIIYRLPIRALRRAVEELETTQAQLVHSEKINAIGEVFTSLAHEINNPLGILIGRAKLMLATAKERQFSQDLVRGLEMIDKHGTRIAEIIRGLLMFSRKTSFNLTETDLNHVISEVVTLVEKPFAQHGTRIESRLDPNLPHISASPDHLQQVFLNLLNNARDAMPEGGTITLRTYPNGRHLVAEVQDTGTGIAANIQSRVFDPFFTTKPRGKGTGLGLSVSYEIVRKHQGDIQVESTPGQGALFRLMLPIEGNDVE